MRSVNAWQRRAKTRKIKKWRQTYKARHLSACILCVHVCGLPCVHTQNHLNDVKMRLKHVYVYPSLAYTWRHNLLHSPKLWYHYTQLATGSDMSQSQPMGE